MTDNESPFIRAGKYSLRVLEGKELARAESALLTNPPFANAVKWWDKRLGSMAEGTALVAPSSGVRDAIIDRIRHENNKGGNT
jgi:anti-sigma-K factor RskA